MKPLREADIQRACEDFLAAARIPYWRMNSGDRFGSTNGKRWRIRGHEKGTPDLLASVRKGDHEIPTFLWIEIKKPGKKPTTEQVMFGVRAIAEWKHFHIVVESVCQLKLWLIANGVT